MRTGSLLSRYRTPGLGRSHVRRFGAGDRVMVDADRVDPRIPFAPRERAGRTFGVVIAAANLSPRSAPAGLIPFPLLRRRSRCQPRQLGQIYPAHVMHLGCLHARAARGTALRRRGRNPACPLVATWCARANYAMHRPWCCSAGILRWRAHHGGYRRRSPGGPSHNLQGCRSGVNMRAGDLRWRTTVF